MKSKDILMVAFTLVLLCFVLASDSSPQTKNPNEVAHKVDELVDALSRLGPFSGSILIAKDGQVLFSKGYGMANVEHDVPNTPQTKFRIASVTKPFTATAVMMLQEQGKLNFQDTVGKYFSPCPKAWRHITIHHLLSHTSGIPNYQLLPEYDKTKPLYSTAGSFIELFKDTPLEFHPGEGSKYSNSNYVLLGYIIENVSGKSYEDFMRASIFDPLTMTNTGYDHPERILKHRAAGYVWRRELVNAGFIEMSNPYAGGGLYSTVEDLFLFDHALFAEKLLSKKSLEVMFTTFKENYGYGWQINQAAAGFQLNRRMIGHSGSIEGFSTNFVHFPEDRVCIIVLSNIEHTRVDEITHYLAAVALGENYNLAEVGSPVDVMVELAPVKVNPRIYDSYIGQYGLPMGVVTVSKDADKLHIQFPGEPEKAEMLPESESKFFIRGPAGVQVEFVKNERGK